MPAYYPIYLDVRGRICQVYGGDAHEAERKIRYFLECGGSVTFFSPEEETCDALRQLAEENAVKWVKRRYQPGDLDGAWIAVVADTSDAEVNEAVSAEARERNVLLNVMDVTPLCTFIAPSIVQRADVTVAISTAGTSPALARRLRERISDHDACQCMRWADLGPTLADARTDIRARNLQVTPNEWQEVMTDELLEIFESGDHDRARRMLMEGLEAKAAAKSSS
ncbi:MAG: bifunctional precorrin-2 dehydrogenase/sirohydrochlorin ferrochelatase [Chloroflexi bacterium]|nr:bifunctional precorrin-2 dehydrogenase/sirohydrochlorin ferrochelatase [Chloroflexota bacterium]